jgi:hypothetical protein
LANIKTNYAAAANVSMTYIDFSEATGQEIDRGDTPTNTLKVTIQGAGYGLTTLLTNSREKSDDPVSSY